MAEVKGPLPKIAIALAIVATIVLVIGIAVAMRRGDAKSEDATGSHRPLDAGQHEGLPVATPPDAAPDPTPTKPVPDTSCAASCTRGEDCKSIACACEDGTVVGTRSCRNGCCLLADDACSLSCANHDGPKGSWNAAREGGKPTGKACRRDDDCGSKVCARGYCTRKCESFADCPPSWECEGASEDAKLCRKN